MRIVADSGPLFAALDRSQRLHQVARRVIIDLGEYLLIPDVVLAEVDYFARARVGADAARAFLAGVALGQPRRVASDRPTFERAIAYDKKFSALNIGLVDATVMAFAEREQADILTFDFAHFRATRPLRGGFWRLVIEEDHLS